uniref:Uncharacterized protein n=1 Tax=Ananas comosus var. bracteatus TaxID=296719 RepID=A0A6V7NSN6_ANACO|nr:unnamed protein product [Ananas comosus var. bracteatus]
MSAGRSSASRQPEASRAPSGRVFVQIGGWIMPIDLLVLNQMWGFDVILGINWLSKYYAVIDCESKVITFREPNQEELVYRACKSPRFVAVLLAARARKMIKGGCVAYLATMVEAQKEHPEVSGIRVAFSTFTLIIACPRASHYVFFRMCKICTLFVLIVEPWADTGGSVCSAFV